ncbi:MAG: hypothetical protein NC238_10180 [Dehalobacter sp.]|nr:hypothetical protein [Dehalobacter sp.]
MKVAFVLGSLSDSLHEELSRRKFDKIYCYSNSLKKADKADKLLLALENPQRDLRNEDLIVSRFADRVVSNVSLNANDALLIRRALKLSVVRLEARFYLNALDVLSVKKSSCDDEIFFISSYLAQEDVAQECSSKYKWESAVHDRFTHVIPYLFHVVKVLKWLLSPFMR